MADWSQLEIRRGIALQEALTAAGLFGSVGSAVAYLTRTAANTVSATFDAGATPTEIADANAIISGWDWSVAADAAAGGVAMVAQPLASSLATLAIPADGTLAQAAAGGVAGDGKGGLYVFDALSTAANDATNYTVVAPSPTVTTGRWLKRNPNVALATSGWTPTNVTTDRAFDANATTLDELADVLGTLIEDLKTYGLLGG